MNGNIKENILYSRQTAILIFIFGMTTKVSRLPAYLAKDVGSTADLFVFILLVLDILVFCGIYFVMSHGGLEAVEQRLNGLFYKIVMAVFSLYFTVKLVFVYSSVVLFVSEQLFENISTVQVVLTLIVPVFYLAYKGILSVARTSEIIVWFVAVSVVLGFSLLDSNMDFTRNLPVLSVDIQSAATELPRYLFWFGDLTPLLFVTLKTKKKLPIIVALLLSVVTIMSMFITMIAMYGPSLQNVTNIFIKLSSFNRFANTIGRLDWLGMISWFIIALIYCSTLLWAAATALEKLTKNKNVNLLVISSALVVAVTLLPDLQKTIEFFTSPISYFASIGNYLIPVIIVIMSAIALKTKKGDMPSTASLNNGKPLSSYVYDSTDVTANKNDKYFGDDASFNSQKENDGWLKW